MFLLPAFQIPAPQASTLLYLLVGTVGIQAVFKASWPFTKLRAFRCATMTVGFFAAAFWFHRLLQISIPSGFTLFLFAGFTLMSFLVERGVSELVQYVITHPKNRHPQKTSIKF